MKENALLDGSVAFVTGGAGTIGRAIAQQYVNHGARVAVADIDLGAAAQVADMLNEKIAKSAIAVRVDITDEGDLADALSLVTAQWGHLNIGIVNAGVLSLDNSVDMILEEWRRVIDVNLTGAFLTARACARVLLDQGVGGRIIFTGSLMAQRGAAQNCAYAATKFGVMGLMQTMAIELASHRINVTAVNPGQVQSQMIEELFVRRGGLTGVSPENLRAKMIEHIPKGRLADAGEVANAYVFLGSALSEYVTGQSLAVDGGWFLV